MLTVFWGVRGVMLMNLFPQNMPFKSAYFNQEIHQPLVAWLQREGWPQRRLWILLHMDNEKPDISKLNLVIMNELHLKRTAHPPCNPDIAPSDFFLFG
jgi:hypothetical protein